MNIRPFLRALTCWLEEKLEEKDFPFSELFLAARTLKDNNLEVLVLSLFFYSTKLVYYRREVVTFITKEGDRAYL